MRDAENAPVRLSEYRPPEYRIETIAMDFALDPNATIVTARSVVQRAADTSCPLVLDGVRLELQRIAIDSARLSGRKRASSRQLSGFAASSVCGMML